jgi:hypothetical protein
MSVTMALMGASAWAPAMLHLSALSMTAMFFYVIFFCIGFGPIPYLIMSEVLPASTRGVAASLATAVNFR